jgi:hypothetical protein
MNNNLPQIVPATKLGNVLHKMVRHAESSHVNHSKDFKLQSTSNGQSIQLAPNAINFPSAFMNYRGEYDVDEHYSPDDVVRVLHDKDYSIYVTGSLHVLPTTPGVYVCIEPVPDRRGSDWRKRIFATDTQYVRVDGADYFPKYPEPTMTKDEVPILIPNATPLQRAKIRYWELISLLPKLQEVCIDGVPKNVFIDMVESGSYGSGSITGSA